ncbi:MAG TPA: D-glucuronyl C5-epimerase family protein [Candidatus Limnocylindrales bacterium]
MSGPGLDGDGIAYKVVSGRNYYNPGSIAMQGCRYIDAYVRTGNPVYLDRAERRAARLRQLSYTARGARWLAYRFNYGSLRAPWTSALAQGAGLSFFVRMYRVTGRPADLTMARGLFLSFRTLGRSLKPWIAYVDVYGYLRLEEYPEASPSHVFNGANFGYFGIYDYAMLTGDPTAVKLARGHLTAMRRYGASYRDPGHLSWYDLRRRTRSVHYHAVNRWQALMLGRMGGGSWFTGLYRAFLADSRAGSYP